MAILSRINLKLDITNNIYTNVIRYIKGDTAQARLLNIADSAANLVTDFSVAGGFLGIDATTSVVDISFIKSVTPGGNYLRDDGTWANLSTAYIPLPGTSGANYLTGTIQYEPSTDYTTAFVSTGKSYYQGVGNNKNLSAATDYAYTLYDKTYNKVGLLRNSGGNLASLWVGTADNIVAEVTDGSSIDNTISVTLTQIILQSQVPGSDRTFFKITPQSTVSFSNYATFAGITYAADYSANFGLRSLIDKGYATNTFVPIKEGSVVIFDHAAYNINDLSATPSIQYVARNLIDSSYNYSINWQSRLLQDTAGVTTLEYGNKKLKNNGTTMIDWSGSNVVLNADATNGLQAVTYQQIVAGYLSLSGGTMTGNLNGVTPTSLNYLSGATSNIQNQLNNLAIGIGGWKAPARVLVNSNVLISLPGATLDGLTIASGERIVLNGQTVASQNGVYIFNGAAVAMTRATDCTTGDYSDTGVLGMAITIEEGTYADQMWILATNAPITVGTTSLNYIKGSATTYTSSAGITLTGNNFSIDNTWFSLSGSGGSFAVSSSGVITFPNATTSIRGLLIASDWTNFQTAYTNRITSLTTTGSSGASTLSSNTLNIPNYTLSGLGGLSTSAAASTYLTIASPAYTGVLTLGTLGYSDTGLLFALQSTVAGYSQTIIRNSSNNSAASTGYITNNDNSTATTYYGEFGQNSSAFTGSGSLNLANAVYVTATSGDLVIGTTTSNLVRFVTNSATTDAMSISTGGVTTIDKLATNITAVTINAAPTYVVKNRQIFSITGLNVDITSMTTNISGTANNGDMIMWQITDNATPRAIAWGTSYGSTTDWTLPTTTVTSKILRVLLQYNSVNSKWECIGVVNG